jgi:hypothetical protein
MYIQHNLNKIDQELLDKFFHYDDGKLYWKISPQQRVKVGDEVGCLSSEGYIKIRFLNKPYGIHRIIFFMFNGTWPEMIDHIDGNKSNNRIENLRSATNQQNQWNTGLIKDNKSGHKGVCFNKQINKWYVSATLNKKQIGLGYYSDLSEAISVRKKFEENNFGVFLKKEIE